MLAKFLLFVCLLIQKTGCFDPSTMIVSRRQMVKLLGVGICYPNLALAEDDPANPKLTEAEMEEYNRLLKEAKRIQSIIDINVKAAEENMVQDRNNLKKSLFERLFPMVEGKNK